MSDQAIVIKGLEYAYKSDWTTKKFKALKGFDLSVAQGESFGFLGHNGAGKTTTIKCILGLIRPTSGTIEVFGCPHTDSNARCSVGYLPEQPYFYDHLTVQELMEMYAHLAGIESGRIQSEVVRALDRVAVSSRAKSPMRSLSKGLTQRVAMAQAIVGGPRLLILDEPFSGLDPIGRRHFKDLLFELKAEGTTIFVSSHILGDIEFLCDRASIMAHGEIKKVLSLSDLSGHSSSLFEIVVRDYQVIEEPLKALGGECEVQDRFFKVTLHDVEQADKALNLITGSDAFLESYQARQGNLEDLFVELVQFEEAEAK